MFSRIADIAINASHKPGAAAYFVTRLNEKYYQNVCRHLYHPDLHVLLNKLQVIKVMLHTKSMKIVRRSTRHHNNKKLLRNPSTSGYAESICATSKKKKISCSNSAKRNHRTSKPWTPHPTFTFYARRAVNMIKASIPASWLACLCIKEKLVLKSDQGISAYFFAVI
jgi:hypothetical protein